MTNLHEMYRALVVRPRRKRHNRQTAAKIATYLESTGRADYAEVASYLRAHIEENLPVFPYDFQAKYAAMTVEGFVDEEGYPYVLHNGKKLFGPKEWTPEHMAHYYVCLLLEQDAASPHRYLADDVVLGADDVVADIGAAEGIFTLDIIERVKKVYLFECEDMWMMPLKKTFAPWGGTVSSLENMCQIKQRVAA